MNILFVMGVYPSYGGVEKVSTILSNEFVRRGHIVSIVSFKQPHPELATEELDAKITLYKLDFPVYRKENITRLKNIINTRKINLIINQWAVPYYVTRLCRKAIKGTSIKLITVHHNLPNTNARIKDIEISLEKGRGNKVFNQIKLLAIKTVSRIHSRLVYHDSDLYVVLSESFIPITKKYMLLKNTNHIVAISNPISLQMPNKTEFYDKANEIIYVGRIEYNQKRTFRIIEIWGKIQNIYPKWSLTFIGDGPDRTDLEYRIKKEGLKRVKIVGFTNPIPYYKRAKILLLTSEYEGFGLVLAEAMTYQCVPIVYGSFPAVHDIIKNHATGIITPPPYNQNEFIEALEQVMINQDLRIVMAKKGQSSVRKFDLKNIADRWEEIFEQISE